MSQLGCHLSVYQSLTSAQYRLGDMLVDGGVEQTVDKLGECRSKNFCGVPHVKIPGRWNLVTVGEQEYAQSPN